MWFSHMRGRVTELEAKFSRMEKRLDGGHDCCFDKQLRAQEGAAQSALKGDLDTDEAVAVAPLRARIRQLEEQNQALLRRVERQAEDQEASEILSRILAVFGWPNRKDLVVKLENLKKEHSQN